ncbi:hypothetical protein GCM10020000_13940 [Streptomyces olivoverticillatus]
MEGRPREGRAARLDGPARRGAELGQRALQGAVGLPEFREVSGGDEDTGVEHRLRQRAEDDRFRFPHRSCGDLLARGDDHRLGRRRGELEDDLGLRGRGPVGPYAQEPQHLQPALVGGPG